MIRDLFARTRAAQMLSTLVLVMAIAPIAVDWRANYSPEHLALYFLAAGGDWCADVYLPKLAARNIAGR